MSDNNEKQRSRWWLASRLKQSIDEDHLTNIFTDILKRQELSSEFQVRVASKMSELPDPVTVFRTTNGNVNSLASAFISNLNRHYTNLHGKSSLDLTCFRAGTYTSEASGKSGKFYTLLFETEDILNAFEAGGWHLVITEGLLLIFPLPHFIRLNAAGRLHSLNGPSLCFIDAEIYSINDVSIPAHVINQPELITLEEIRHEWNVEVRRIMIERYGVDRYILDSEAEVISEEAFRGRDYLLYSQAQVSDEALVMLKVTNATPEPDGSFKDYWIRVPPTTESVMEALAWTFNMQEDKYRFLFFES